MDEGLVLTSEHEYFFNGRRLDGCTNTLAEAGLLDRTHYTEEGALRGTAVHEAIRQTFLGENPKVLRGHKPYVAAAFQCLKDIKAEVLHAEWPLAAPLLGIAGMPDVIAEVDLVAVADPPFAVIDWKTGQPERWHRYQTAWYEHLARANGLVEGLCERIVVHLKPDGTYTTRRYADRHDWKVADAARIVVQARRAA